MFIDQGTPVTVINGPLLGRFGVVSKIRIFKRERLIDVMVFCELFNYETGVFDALAVEPDQIERRRLTLAQVEQLQLDVLRAAA